MRISIFKNREAVEEAVTNSSSMREAIETLGLRPAGGNYKSLVEACQRFNLIVPRSSGPNQTKNARAFNKRPDAEIFVEDSDYTNRTHIKSRLYALGVKEECAECGLGPVWNKRPITLQLDHINGVANDNRIENLQILCPNCHSQTDTYCGGNFRNPLHARPMVAYAEI